MTTPAPIGPGLCRDCSADVPEGDGRCPRCGSPRIVRHPELHALAIAHIDCDAFYASVEKRDDPSLRNRPVIVGGGRRGVVAAACYLARLKGVRSAMPMYRALELCPEAVVRRPDMARYRKAGHLIRELMRSVTPLVEPLSIDEAFLDLSGTERLHRASPARTLAALIRRIETEVGVTASVGLSYNKFLAKLASDLDKPRGFAVIGRAEAPDFLAPRPISTIFGVGAALAGMLERDGIATIADLRTYDERVLVGRYGTIGHRLYAFSRGRDQRAVDPSDEAKSISAETTLDRDEADPARLARHLWALTETVTERLIAGHHAAAGVTLKLKTAQFRLLTRSRRLATPTALAETIYRTALPLLETEADGRKFRLIGIGTAPLVAIELADPPDLLSGGRNRTKEVETALRALRRKFGRDAITKGRGFVAKPRPGS